MHARTEEKHTIIELRRDDDTFCLRRRPSYDTSHIEVNIEEEKN